MTSVLSLPEPLRQFFALFPLHSYPPIYPPTKIPVKAPTLWVSPPRTKNELLSSDVECLKWQAYLALKGLTGISVSWDVCAEGGIDGRLPNLQVPMERGGDGGGELLAAHLIPTWVESQTQADHSASADDLLEGYKDEAARDESRAWVTLLEGTVHAALILHQPPPPLLKSIISADLSLQPLKSILSPPPAPQTGISSIVPPYGIRISASVIEAQYREAITALSDRLGSDRWFLGSEGPTAVDALLFAYLHSILHATDVIRIEVTRRVNLVAWEWKLRSQVRAAFQKADTHIDKI